MLMLGDQMPVKEELPSLADMRRKECKEELNKLSDQELLEQVNAHFASHPALPGEKEVKDFARERLDHTPNTYDLTHGWLDETGRIVLDPDVCQLNGKPTRDEIIDVYAKTRIRETKTHLIKGFDLSDIKTDTISNQGVVSMSRADVNIVKRSFGDVYIEAPDRTDTLFIIGTVPNKFFTNNPMNVESCKGELQMTDYSNGKMANVSVRLVVDTDRMSGDIVSLNEDMLEGFDDDCTMKI